jgi:hypothetical protein|tara:strand:+ start:725 stop:1486 length:762 start_codon:yes stop_codon:yes gene_type:complete
MFAALAEAVGLLAGTAAMAKSKADAGAVKVSHAVADNLSEIIPSLISKGIAGTRAAQIVMCNWYDVARTTSKDKAAELWQAMEEKVGTLKDAKARGRNTISAYRKALQLVLWGIEYAPEETADAFAAVPEGDKPKKFIDRLKLVRAEFDAVAQRKTMRVQIFRNEVGYIYLAAHVFKMTVEEQNALKIVYKEPTDRQVAETMTFGKLFKHIKEERTQLSRRSADVTTIADFLDAQMLEAQHEVTADNPITKGD